MTGFADLWDSYPRKLAKKDAEKAYNQALKRGVTHEAIMASLRIMVTCEWKGRALKYIPYAGSFLRGEAFVERFELLEDEAPELDSEVRKIITQDWDRIVEELRLARLK